MLARHWVQHSWKPQSGRIWLTKECWIQQMYFRWWGAEVHAHPWIVWWKRMKIYEGDWQTYEAVWIGKSRDSHKYPPDERRVLCPYQWWRGRCDTPLSISNTLCKCWEMGTLTPNPQVDLRGPFAAIYPRERKEKGLGNWNGHSLHQRGGQFQSDDTAGMRRDEKASMTRTFCLGDLAGKVQI